MDPFYHNKTSSTNDSSSDQSIQNRVNEQVKKDLNFTNETSASIQEDQKERNEEFNQKVIEMNHQATQHPLIQ